MMKKQTTILLTALAIFTLGAPRVGQAQVNSYFMPVEDAVLESHIDLQIHYSNLSVSLGQLGEMDLDLLNFSLEAQYVFWDRLEVGLNVPFVSHGAAGLGGRSFSATEFGDIMLNLKARIFGGSLLGMAFYLNTQLPTHSGGGYRSYANMQMGPGVTASLLGLKVGGNIDFWWLPRGSEGAHTGEDFLLVGPNVYAGYTFLTLLTFKLAVQYLNSLQPSSDLTAIAITPGMEVSLLKIIRAGLSVRIAATDDAKLLFGGRASVLFSGGIAF